MKCKRVQKMLAKYVNEVLETENSRRIQRHIAECDACRRELDILKKMLGLIDDVKVEYPPASVWENFLPDLHKRIENEAALIFSKRQKQRLYLLPGWAATAGIILALFASLIAQDHSAIRSTVVRRAGDVQISEYPSPEESGSESMLVTGVISRVLLTEAEAEKLKELGGAVQPETPMFPHIYRYGAADVLIDVSEDTDTVLNGKDVIQYLEDRFTRFDESLIGIDDSELGIDIVDGGGL